MTTRAELRRLAEAGMNLLPNETLDLLDQLDRQEAEIGRLREAIGEALDVDLLTEALMIVEGRADGPLARRDAESIADEYARLAAEGDAGPGWWHGPDCEDIHDADHNCLDASGSIIGWRDPVISARLAYTAESTPSSEETTE